MIKPVLLQALQVFLLARQALAVACPPLNPPLPLNGPLAGRPAITDAAEALRASIETDRSVSVNLTSFSVDFYSLQDRDSVFTYHFSSPELAESSQGVQQVDSDTIYRVGSISKVFTVYTYLASVGDLTWNQPITRYVPELARNVEATADESNLDAVRWDDVTIGSLAAQLSGVSRQSAPNAAADQVLAAGLGFPEVPGVPGRYCSGNVGAQLPCDREAFFTNLFAEHPVVPPESSAIYSNIAYLLLAYAAENMTDTLFPQLMNDTVLSALSLDSTYYPLPPESAFARAVIPVNDSSAWFSTDLRTLNPGGAVYSTTNDMRAFGKSILNSTLVAPAMTRRWLKPHSFNPDSYIAVGAPWEILSYPPTSRFPLRIYSKAGDVGLYSAQMGLLPDYNVGFTLLAAGLPASLVNRAVSDLIVDHFLPAVKQVAVTQARESYAGTYSSEDGTNSTVSLTLSPDDDEVGPTLQVDSLIWNGTDLTELYAAVLGVNFTEQELQTDLYPTGLRQRLGDGRMLESWRVNFNVQPLLEAAAAQTNITQVRPYQESCGSWAQLDALKYGGVSIDEVMFTWEEGNLTAIELRFLQQDSWGKEGGGSAGNTKRAEKVKMVKKKVQW